MSVYRGFTITTRKVCLAYRWSATGTHCGYAFGLKSFPCEYITRESAIAAARKLINELCDGIQPPIEKKGTK